MTLPESMSVEALTAWARDLAECDLPAGKCRSCLAMARAVLALVRDERRERDRLWCAALAKLEAP